MGVGLFAATVSDARRRGQSTVGELGDGELLRPLPALTFPAEIVLERVASRSALIAFEANSYSVPPGYAGSACSSAPGSESRNCGSSPAAA